MNYIPGLKEVFKYLLIIILIVFIILMLYFNNTEINNKFEVKLNDKSLTFRKDTEYVDYILKKNGDGHHYGDLSVNENLFNSLNKTGNYKLEIREYEVYNKFEQRVNYQTLEKNYTYVEVIDNNKKMMIQKSGKIIYDGDYKNDLTDIINENGRYYFHIYTKSKRNTSPFAYVKSNIHFNVLIGDNNE